MYQNVTGPGDYNAPGFAERMFGEADASKRTYPSYTFGDKTPQPYFPTYAVDFKGRDSPGLSKYHPKLRNTSPEYPKYTIKKADRFAGPEERTRSFLSNIPQYKAEPSDFEKKVAGYSISKGKCWTLHTDKEAETTPGPAYETQYHNSMIRKVETTEELKHSSFGVHTDK